MVFLYLLVGGRSRVVRGGFFSWALSGGMRGVWARRGLLEIDEAILGSHGESAIAGSAVCCRRSRSGAAVRSLHRRTRGRIAGWSSEDGGRMVHGEISWASKEDAAPWL